MALGTAIPAWPTIISNSIFLQWEKFGNVFLSRVVF